MENKQCKSRRSRVLTYFCQYHFLVVVIVISCLLKGTSCLHWACNKTISSSWEFYNIKQVPALKKYISVTLFPKVYLLLSLEDTLQNDISACPNKMSEKNIRKDNCLLCSRRKDNCLLEKVTMRWKKLHPSTCKWLFTWYMVKPSTFISFSTPLGVASAWFCIINTIIWTSN